MPLRIEGNLSGSRVAAHGHSMGVARGSRRRTWTYASREDFFDCSISTFREPKAEARDSCLSFRGAAVLPPSTKTRYVSPNGVSLWAVTRQGTSSVRLQRASALANSLWGFEPTPPTRYRMSFQI